MPASVQPVALGKSSSTRPPVTNQAHPLTNHADPCGPWCSTHHRPEQGKNQEIVPRGLPHLSSVTGWPRGCTGSTAQRRSTNAIVYRATCVRINYHLLEKHALCTHRVRGPD